MLRTKFWVYPYGYSQSAFALVEGLGGRIIKRERSKYVHAEGDVVINWGAASRPEFLAGVAMLNDPDRVLTATSKVGTYRKLAEEGIRTCEWTSDNALANQWAGRGRVLGRDLDHGSQGRGIHVYAKGSHVPEHRFYTRYVKKEREFRVHVFKGRVIFVQEKLRKRNTNADRYIRSHGRGWCFGFTHLANNPPNNLVLDQGVVAVLRLGLDFGAVDIAWSDRTGATVLEVNTAPGIENTSLAAYVEAFQNGR